jgi:hypothetical protein
MKLCLKILVVAITAVATYPLTSCAGPAGFSYQNVTINFNTVPIQCSDCPGGINFNPANPAALYMPYGGGQGGTVLITATVTNAPVNITWTIFPQPNLGSIDSPPTGTSTPVGESGSSVGTITAASGNTIYYSAPGSLPIYSGAALQQAQSFQWTYNGVPQVGIPQGDTLLQASVPSDPSNPSAVAVAYQLFQVYSSPSLYLVPAMPATPTGITAPIVNVARGTSFAFYGGVVGAVPCTTTAGCLIAGTQYPLYTADNTPVWSVGPAPFSTASQVVGGNATLGTITQNGVYTAPTTIPSPLPVVWMTSQQLPTITAASGSHLSYAYVGIY